MKITIRETTAAERRTGIRNSSGAALRPEYVCCNAAVPANLCYVFGLVQGGDTREEAVFWAERMASKNGLELVRPEGWEDVVGALPETV